MEKKRPDWQAGKLNGVGGKIEAGETKEQAMCREFFEETGVTTQEDQWHLYCKLVGRYGDVFVYRLFDDAVLQASTKGDEEVFIREVDYTALKAKALSNLVWLIDIALDQAQPIFFVEADYKYNFSSGYKAKAA